MLAGRGCVVENVQLLLSPDIKIAAIEAPGNRASVRALTRFARALYWLAPIGLCLVLYWPGLRVWFAQDDFYWLSLHTYVHDARSLVWAMFAPMAQGTIRPISERGFFLLLSYLFGLDALPFRVFVFLNQFANALLITALARKLTGSALTGILAPALWLCNIALVAPMSWNSAYNEIQCATFFLVSFYLFLRYLESGRRSFYWWQCAVFVIGLGALELNVVYPAIIALYSFLFARKYLRSTVPLFAISAIYLGMHFWVVPSISNPYYQMRLQPASLIATLTTYWKNLFGFPAFARWEQLSGTWAAVAVLVTVPLLGFIAWQIWRGPGRKLTVFLCGWFLIVLSLLLPFSDHITEYYLTVPSIGLAILAAYGVSLAWQSHRLNKTVALLAVLAYTVPSAVFIHAATRVYLDRADRARSVICSAEVAKQLKAGKTVILEDVDDEFFWTTLYFHPFRLFGWNKVYVGPESRNRIKEDAHFSSIRDYFVTTDQVDKLLRSNDAVVYALNDRTLRDVTQSYWKMIDFPSSQRTR